MKKVLIVDDDPDIVEAMRIGAWGTNLEVHSAINGTEGLRKVKEINPDLTILDVMMMSLRKGSGGLAIEKCQSQGTEYAPFSKIPILMLTSLTKRGVHGF